MMESLVSWLKHFLLFNPERPITFTVYSFWIFFLGILIVDALVYKRQKFRSLYLFGASVFFYYKTSGFFFLLLLFSIHMDYFIGRFVYHSANQRLRKILIVLSVCTNLLILCYFKYSYFFADSWLSISGSSYPVVNHIAGFFREILSPVASLFGDNNSLSSFTSFRSTFSSDPFFRVDKIILPVGISFYTFQTVSYSIDIYRGHLKPARSLIDFGFFVSFFPQLVAGPIVRASDFIPQMYKPYTLSRDQFGLAVFWILNGLIKKLLVGDYIAVNFVDRVFSNPNMYTGFENLFAVMAYSLQVYCDFSGYTDIAIGVALLMGFHLTQNFNSPYKADNVGEFWRRWHISLSTWLRDYLYIPLGGNKSAGFGSLFWMLLIGTFIGAMSWAYWTKDFLGGTDISKTGFFTALADALATKSFKPADYFIAFCITILSLFAPIAIILFSIGLFNQPVRKFISTEINLMITMLLGGLWHGPNWMFVIWGGLNGLGIVFYKQWKKISPFRTTNSIASRIYAVSLTYFFISFTRIFFRAANTENPMQTAKDVVNRICGFTDPDVLWLIPVNRLSEWITSNKFVLILCFFGLLVHWLSESIKQKYRSMFINSPHWIQALAVVLVVLLIYQSLSAELQPFIYFQF